MPQLSTTEANPSFPFRHRGRSALVTGGSRGVGRAIALRLAAEGARVAITYRRDTAAAEDVVRSIVDRGGQAQMFRLAIGEDGALAAMIADLWAEFGAVDLVVSNAGSASRGETVEATPIAEFESLLRVHTLGPIGLLQHLLPQLRLASRADVVMISSAVTESMPSGAAPYTMAKVAMEAAVRTLALEERAHGIRANIVAPGLVDTEMGARLATASTGTEISGLSHRLPFGRVCTPADVAGVVAFLASEDAGYVTGQRIMVNGGGPQPSLTGA